MTEWYEWAFLGGLTSGVLIGGAQIAVSRINRRNGPVVKVELADSTAADQRRLLGVAAKSAGGLERAAQGVSRASSQPVERVTAALQELDVSAASFFQVWTEAQMFRILRLQPAITELVERSEEATSRLSMQALLLDQTGKRLLGAERLSDLSTSLADDMAKLQTLLHAAVTRR